MDDERTNQNASKLQGAGGQASAASPCTPRMRDFVSDWSPLHEASIHGRLLSLKKLLEQGNDVNLVTTDQVSPLHEACLGGHAACASVLLKHGAQVDGVTVDWHTPLFNTCVSGSVACLNLLLEHGASLQPPCDLASPIHEAAKRGHVQCVELLASRGVNIDHNIQHLGTPLYVACENQQVNCAKKLLESGASVNSGKGLDSPLHTAARNCSVELVKLLMDFGADLWVKNAENKRPVELVPPGCPLGQLFLQREGMGPAATHRSAVVTTLFPWVLPRDISCLTDMGARMLRLHLFFPLPCFLLSSKPKCICITWEQQHAQHPEGLPCHP
ncbi:ankyrin repeat and SOCS box protein 9 isoform X1 [Serinus canaria]|uniref:ankyrin repeat and SOCS box protein 9 isoform X1 n=1 Tax=Serinus canaria TaxID=9135 RepID=UPI0011AE714D|nr:ankyrin repeat and SOCS box protein 9 isoform X1 [Serinus canaria]